MRLIENIRGVKCQSIRVRGPSVKFLRGHARVETGKTHRPSNESPFPRFLPVTEDVR